MSATEINLDYEIEKKKPISWEEWKIRFEKTYPNVEEHDKRKKIWQDNDDFIQKHNAEFDEEKHGYDLAHNKFSDQTLEEMNQYKGFDRNAQAKTHNSVNYNLDLSYLPICVDWREDGLVNPVQDQGKFSNSYAYSACAAIEAMHFMKTEKLVKCSEQNIIDGSKSHGNHGLNGGTMDNVFRYVAQNGGINLEADYPYEAKENETCKYKPENAITTVEGFVDVPEGNERALYGAIIHVGPVSVAIDASQRTFQFYNSGIYEDPAVTETPDHALSAIGYGTIIHYNYGYQDYYLLRNSWGTSWGEEKGFMRIIRNSKTKPNFGGIASMASFPY